MNTHATTTVTDVFADDLPRWNAALQSVADQTLTRCPDFPAIARRFDAWWQQEVIDRPILVATCNTRPDRPVTRRLDLLDDEDAWMAAKEEDLRQVRCAGDALPHMRVDLGAVAMAAFMDGIPRHFESDTAWVEPFVDDDWSNLPDLSFRADHPMWRKTERLLSCVAERAAGRYLVCTPDIFGPADLLTNIRGATGICIDILDQPRRIVEAIDAQFIAWAKVFADIYDTVTSHGAGIVHWLNIWSSSAYSVPACDLGYMIGTEEYNAICLPDIARQAQAVGRAVFHLDGPGATRHLDALLDIPHIRAIQFTPGEGTPSVMPWLDMFRRIQSRGRSLYVITPPDEVLALTEALRPEGLGILTSINGPASQLNELYDAFCRTTLGHPPAKGPQP